MIGDLFASGAISPATPDSASKPHSLSFSHAPGLGPGSRRSFRAPHALAQAPATITASRSAEISAFAEFTTVSAGYCSPCRAKGIVFGADYTHFSRRLLNPALEVCGSVASGSPYTENSLALGLHLGPELGRLHHYADLLAGVGSIHYNPPIVYPDGTVYSYDNSAVFQVGGGLQDDVRSNWAIQAEVEAQRWNLGSTTPSSSIPSPSISASSTASPSTPTRPGNILNSGTLPATEATPNPTNSRSLPDRAVLLKVRSRPELLTLFSPKEQP